MQKETTLSSWPGMSREQVGKENKKREQKNEITMKVKLWHSYLQGLRTAIPWQRLLGPIPDMPEAESVKGSHPDTQC